MTRSRLCLRLFAVGSSTAVFTALATTPASAAPVSPRANVWIESFSGAYAQVCAEGAVNDGTASVARWVFTVTTVAPSGLPPAAPYVQVAATNSFFDCRFVYAGGPPDAVLTATLSFAGATTDTTALTSTDMVGVAGLVYEWNSVLGHGNATSFGSDG